MSSCAGLSIHAPMAPPHFQGSVGGGTSSAQRTSLLLCKSHRNWAFFNTPTRCETSQATNYFLLGFRATPSIPTSKRSSLAPSKRKTGPPQAGLPGSGPAGPPAPGPPGLQGPQGPFPRVLTRLHLPGPPRGPAKILGRGLQGPPGTSRGLQGPPGASQLPNVF